MAAQLDSYDERRLIDNRPGYGRHGQPVHPNFDDQLHVASARRSPSTPTPIW